MLKKYFSLFSSIFTYIGGASSGKQMNAMYRANKNATKAILNGGIGPKAKAKAADSVKSYYKALGRYIGAEIKEAPLSSAFSTFSCEYIKGAVGFGIGW